MNEVDIQTGRINWQKFWINHPRKHYGDGKSVLWANMRLADYNYETAFQEIDSRLKIKEGDYVLDVGCGTGEMLPYIGKIVHDSGVVGIDASETMVEIARSRYPNIFIQQAYAHCLPFTDDSFDKIICNGVIQHISYDFFIATLDEFMRVLKVGGKVFIGDIVEDGKPETQIYNYPKSMWKQFTNVKFSRSSFEKRLNVLMTK